MRRLLIAVLFLILLPPTAKCVELGPGKHIVNGLIVTVPINSTVEISVPTSTVQIGPVNPGPVNPGPVNPNPIVVDPASSLSEVVVANVAAIPDYPDKTVHRRSLAFTLTFFSQMIKGDALLGDDTRAELKKACDRITEDDASKWATLWAEADAKIGTGITESQYGDSMREIATALTDGLLLSGGEEFGQPSFGLREDFLKILMEFILPFLLKFLATLG